jgi:hypothetical protein
MKKIIINFYIQSYVKQRVSLHGDVELTPQQLQDLLSSGKVVTTIQEDGDVILLSADEKESDTVGKQIGTVIEVDNECEYSEFEVEND